MARKTARTPAKKAPRPAPRPAGAAAAIHQLDEAFMKAAARRDGGALVRAFYAANAVLMPPNHPAVAGRKNIQAFFQGLMGPSFGGITLETAAVESAGGLAYGRGRYRLALTSPAGQPVEDTGKYVVVYRRQPNGAWRAVADIFNSDQPTG